ncbi:MAG: hypothetical protein CL811_12735, partial [Colwelliaceae bacterium]|nr:hypothetical protein [Colwelliaceae bacterium]
AYKEKDKTSDFGKKLLDEFGAKAFTVIKEKERVKPEHVGQVVKLMYAARADKFKIFAYVVREPLGRDYVQLAHCDTQATFVCAVTECKLTVVRKTRKPRTKKPKKEVEQPKPTNNKTKSKPKPGKITGRKATDTK